MNGDFIYVGDDLLDLYGDTVIALTVKRIEIGDLESRYVSFSNTFKLPPTENNLQILGNPDNENSASTTPYKFISCRLVQGGIETLKNAKLYITNVNKDISITVFEDIVDFFQQVKNKLLTDIDPIAASAWTAAGIDSARTNTSGIISAVLSWGKSGAIYQSNYFLPSFFYHTLIREILEYTGLTLSGDILTDSRFTDLVVPFPGKEFLYPESLLVGFNSKGYATANQTLTGLKTTPVKMNISTSEFGSANIDTALDRYTVPSTLYPTLKVDLFLTGGGWTLNDATQVNVAIYKNGVTILDQDQLTGPTDTLELSYTGSFNPTDYIDVRLWTDALVIGADVTIDMGINDTYLRVIAQRTINRDMVSWNALWPEISCSDLLKDFFTRFALIPLQTDTTLYLKSIESIITDPANSLDWSDKLVKTIPDIDFGLDYAQNNYFNYENSDDVNDPALGQGNIEIANDIVDVDKTIYDSLFGNSRITEIGSYRVAIIPVYDSTSTGIDTFANEPGLRLLTLKDRSIEPTVTFDALSRSDYKLAYFVDSTQTKDTGFEYFLGQFYPSLEICLQKNKVVNKYFNLTQFDIYAYTPHKTVWDGNNYYLVNIIDKFRPSIVTKAVLFKT